MKQWWLILLAALVMASQSQALELPAPGHTDTCPVCGMFVARYPEWIATVVYRDGHAHHFDGAKDLFKYLLDMQTWAPGHRPEDITDIGVTEYYGLGLIPAREAWYVIGSDVLGPMGHELIPLENAADAKAFNHDHAGRRVLRFDEVTGSMLEKLDIGEFEMAR